VICCKRLLAFVFGVVVGAASEAMFDLKVMFDNAASGKQK
jgi:hypothetical protein